MTARGDLTARTNSSSGRKLTLSSLNLDGSEVTAGLVGRIEAPSGNWILGLHRFASNGNGQSNGEYASGSILIPDGAPTAASLDLLSSRIEYSWDWYPNDSLLVQFGGGATYIDFGSRIRDRGTNASISNYHQTVLPSVHARGVVRIAGIDLSVASNLGGADYGDSSSVLVAINAAAEWRFGAESSKVAGAATIGYQWLDFSSDVETGNTDFKSDITLQGPFLGIGASW